MERESSLNFRWEHSEDWYAEINIQRQRVITAERVIDINLKDENYEYITHHVIDGRNLIPAMGYLVMVWDMLSLRDGKFCDDMPVVFENIKFERATSISSTGTVSLKIIIQKGTILSIELSYNVTTKLLLSSFVRNHILLSLDMFQGSGKFEITEGSAIVATGTIRKVLNPRQEMIDEKFLTKIEDEEIMTNKDIYTELRLRGYEYAGPFCALNSSSLKGTRGHISWMKNWAVFMDNMLQMKILGFDTKSLYVPTAIRKIVIDTKFHNEIIRHLTEKNNGTLKIYFRNIFRLRSTNYLFHQLKMIETPPATNFEKYRHCYVR